MPSSTNRHKQWSCDRLLACVLISIVWLVVARLVFIFWSLEASQQRFTIDFYAKRSSGSSGSLNVTRPSVDRTVKHQWRLCSNRRFVIMDTYVVPLYSLRAKPSMVLVGYGNVSMEVGEFECAFNTSAGTYTTKAIARVNGTVYALPDKVDMYVVWFTCPLPPRLWEQGRTLERGTEHGYVSLNQKRSSFKCESLVVKWFVGVPRASFKLTLCTSCVYGLKSNQWLIEYIEYYRAIGAEHVEFYADRLGKDAHRVVDFYRKSGFVTRHDWTNPLANRGVPGVRLRNWEHGQILTRNDCYLRNYGVSQFIVLADIDELYVSRSSLYSVLRKLSGEHPKAIAFNMASVTVPPFVYKTPSLPRLNVSLVVPFWMSKISVVEKSCRKPFNCGKYHYGRQKYALKTTTETPSTLSSIWYHAVSIDYTIADRYTAQVPATMAYIRHYNKQFPHVVNGLKRDNRRVSAIDIEVLAKMSVSLEGQPYVLQAYRESHKETMWNLFSLQKRIVAD